MKELTTADGRVIPNTEDIKYKTIEEIEAGMTPESLKRWRKLQADLLAKCEAIKARRRLIAMSENVVVFRERRRRLDAYGAPPPQSQRPSCEAVVIPFELRSPGRRADQDGTRRR